MSDLHTKQKEEREIDIARLGKALLRWSWLLVAVALVFGIAGYVYSANYIAPTYRSTFTAYVLSREPSEKEEEISVGELNASIGLAYAYSDIIRSRSVLKEAARQSGYDISYGELAGKLTISASETTAILTVSVDDTDPQRAYRLAKAVCEIAPERVNVVTSGGTMNILDTPEMPGGPVAPSNKNNAMLGAMIGFFFALVFVIIRELINDKVQNAQELEKRFQITVVGSIPNMQDTGRRGARPGYARTGGRSK